MPHLRKAIFQATPAPAPDAATPLYPIFGPVGLLAFTGYVMHRFGPVGAAKLALKLASRRVIFIVWREEGRPVFDATIAVGYCRHYPVARDEGVVTAIHTRRDRRGRGYATQGLRAIIAHPVCARFSKLYIDADPENAPSIAAIQKAGFQHSYSIGGDAPL